MIKTARDSGGDRNGEDPKGLSAEGIAERLPVEAASPKSSDPSPDTETEGLAKRLESEPVMDGGDGPFVELWEADRDAVVAHLRTLEAENERLRGALKPFAAWVVPNAGTVSGWGFGTKPTTRDYLHAHAVLKCDVRPDESRTLSKGSSNG